VDVNATATSCRSCGAGPDAFDDLGFCSVCGLRERPEPVIASIDAGTAAAITHPGLRREENQDAMYLQHARAGVAAVVCDGISSCADPARAARTAAGTAGGVLAERVLHPAADLRAGVLAAVAAAQAAVSALPCPVGADPPSCTLVAAVCREGELTVASVGDSRAYWLASDGGRLLTVDDARAHAVTHWIGADAPTVPPRVVTLAAPSGGRLVLCSDGLWNYAAAPQELAAAERPGAAPAQAARALLDHALARGGHDNVTVAVIDVPPKRRPGP
jgi:serine/threonine protein phosphatase PrpC